MGTQAQFPITPKAGVVQINNGNGTTAQTLMTGGSTGTKIVGLNLANTDTAAKIAQIFLVRSSTSYLIGSVSVPAGAGNDGSTAAVNALSSAMVPGLPVDNDGNRYLFLQSGDTLTVGVTVAMTSGKLMHCVAVE